MEPETIGGKPREHWESVMGRLKSLICTLDRVADLAAENDQEEAENRARNDIDALIDALVVIDFDVEQRFGKKEEKGA